MANDTFVMSARQAAELDHSLERNGFTPAMVKKLSEGDTLAQIIPFLNGQADITIYQHIIDCDADPFCPEDWSVEEHIKGGQLKWGAAKIDLYLCKEQEKGSIEGNQLRKKLKDQTILNACVLDYLIENPNLIPEEWKNKNVFFWGTIYRDSDGSLCVRGLSWDGDGWGWDYHWLGFHWRGSKTAVVSVAS